MGKVGFSSKYPSGVKYLSKDPFPLITCKCAAPAGISKHHKFSAEALRAQEFHPLFYITVQRYVVKSFENGDALKASILVVLTFSSWKRKCRDSFYKKNTIRRNVHFLNFFIS